MDARFQHVSTDPVFKKRTKKKKFLRDSRFQVDEEESSPFVSDKYGGVLTAQIDDGLLADDSSYSSEEESDEEEEEEVEVKAWDADLPATFVEGQVTSRRVAVTDCEWEHVKARDLLAILKSVCPRGGSVLEVRVYMSQFGLDEEEHENKHGPRIVGTGPEAIRRYEMSKLRRYFAVAVLDSEETAAVVAQNDGVEIEATSAPLNLSLVPRDVEFDSRRERDCAKADTFSPEDYSPPSQYYVKARQMTKVECTWETDDHQRQVAFKAQDDEALERYVAQSDDDDGDEAARAKKRDLLLGKEEDEDEEEEFFQFEFQPALESSGVDADDEAPRRQRKKKATNETRGEGQSAPQVFAAEDDEDEEDVDTRDLVKAERLKNKKLRGKRKRDRQQLEKRIKSDFKFDPQDPRFASKDSRFSLDPTAPAFKKTANMNKLLAKQRSIK